MKKTNKTPILYVSGWMGNGKASSTYRFLEKHFANLDAFAAGGRTDVKELTDELSQKAIDLEKQYGKNPIIVGNSYGGYLASFLGYLTVLVNPTLYASETLPDIAELSEEEISRFRTFEKFRDVSNTYWDRASFFPVLSTADSVIKDHKISKITSNEPVMVPGGDHRLTDEQREKYLLPVINKVLELSEENK